MNSVQAQGRINFYCPPNEDPALTDNEVAFLLSLAATEDAAGLAPDDDDWTPTYSARGCLYAAREGWIRKKAKVVGRFDFTTDDQSFRRSQIADHCDEQIDTLSRRLGIASPIGGLEC